MQEYSYDLPEMGKGHRSRHQFLLDRERGKDVRSHNSRAVSLTQFRRRVGFVDTPDLSSERQIMMFRIVAGDQDALAMQLQVFRESQLEAMNSALEKTVERLARIDKALHPPPPPPPPKVYTGGGGWGGWGGGSAGAVFDLIANDGKADRLNERIRDITLKRGTLYSLQCTVATNIREAVDLIEKLRPTRKRLRIESCARMLMSPRLPEELVELVDTFAFKPRPPCPPELCSAS